ncbi:MAG: hypothetical protein ACR2O8_11440 [Rhizobiaceae bacterium]
MAYITVSHWACEIWNDELEAIARDKYIPLIMSVGASKAQMIRTGELAFCVVTEYSDGQAAQAAQERIAEIRSQAAEEMPMTMTSSHGGEVFVHS